MKKYLIIYTMKSISLVASSIRADIGYEIVEADNLEDLDKQIESISEYGNILEIFEGNSVELVKKLSIKRK